MPNFESPLGNNKFYNTQMKEFEIPDESNFQYDSTYNVESEETSRIEREIKTAKEIKRTGKERLNEGAKKRLEMLLGMTRIIKPVKIGDNEFVLQSLKSKEMREIIMKSSAYDNTYELPFENRRQVLARSIVSISGVDFSQFVGSESLDTKLAFIDELDDAFLSRLFDEYVKIVQEAKEKFSIKNEEDVENVIKDLKK